MGLDTAQGILDSREYRIQIHAQGSLESTGMIQLPALGSLASAI